MNAIGYYPLIGLGTVSISQRVENSEELSDICHQLSQAVRRGQCFGVMEEPGFLRVQIQANWMGRKVNGFLNRDAHANNVMRKIVKYLSSNFNNFQNTQELHQLKRDLLARPERGLKMIANIELSNLIIQIQSSPAFQMHIDRQFHELYQTGCALRDGKLLSGENISVDIDSAMNCFREAADGGHLASACALAKLLIFKSEISNSIHEQEEYLQEAKELLSHAADCEYAPAQYEYGELLRQKNEPDLEDTSAQTIYWWKRALKNGFTEVSSFLWLHYPEPI